MIRNADSDEDVIFRFESFVAILSYTNGPNRDSLIGSALELKVTEHNSPIGEPYPETAL